MSRVFALILVMGLLILSGCVVDTEVTPGAIAVWQQNEGNDWEIRYSLWDDAGRTWYVPNGGITELIASMEGDDHDPYIDSDGVDTAISVWSHEEGGSADIYYSVWKADAWSTPQIVGSSLTGYDSDPAVAMDPSGNAVAVWVNKNSDGTTMLYYSKYTGKWSTPSPVKREHITVSLPELSFSPTSGIYFLIWTEATDAGTRVFSSGYSSVWAPPIIIPGQTKSAILDNNAPTDERIGLGTAGKKREAMAVWGTSNGELYSSTWTPSGWSNAVLYGEKKMPDAEYEYGGVPYSVFIKDDDLHWSKDLYSPNGVTPVPGTKEDFRPALTFIGDRIVGLSVYWTQAVAPSEIYYARWTGSAWEGVAPIDPSNVPGQDRNPDVSPLQKEDQIWDYYVDWCGDGIIQWPNIWGQFEE
ncbi:MAG: hypothetical protein GY852_02875, partial [bacterium]|nr:hypothetical protein [bacterium]